VLYLWYWQTERDANHGQGVNSTLVTGTSVNLTITIDFYKSKKCIITTIEFDILNCHGAKSTKAFVFVEDDKKIIKLILVTKTLLFFCDDIHNIEH
jgi:hypothetical protein